MQDLTNLTNLHEKVKNIDFLTFHSKSVESCINSWTDLHIDLSELVAAHLVYMNLNVHGHSFNIECDISILLKGIENCKSQVVATLLMPHTSPAELDHLPFPMLTDNLISPEYIMHWLTGHPGYPMQGEGLKTI